MGNAARTSTEATSVATASAQSAANAQAVASASEQLTASINENAKQVETARVIAARADEEATETTEMVHRLSQTVTAIRRDRFTDQRHRQPDQSPGVERDDRGGSRGRCRQRVRGGCQRGEEPRQSDRQGNGRDRQQDRCGAGRHRGRRDRDLIDYQGDVEDERDQRHDRRRQWSSNRRPRRKSRAMWTRPRPERGKCRRASRTSIPPRAKPASPRTKSVGQRRSCPPRRWTLRTWKWSSFLGQVRSDSGHHAHDRMGRRLERWHLPRSTGTIRSFCEASTPLFSRLMKGEGRDAVPQISALVSATIAPHFAEEEALMRRHR